jgi:ATP-binding cassette subfamily F protein uup
LPDLLVSLQGVAKAFGAAPLFADLSFGVFEGDHVGLIGPNGSGKSTLLRILAGLDEPSAGTRSARKRLRVGYVEQDPTFASGGTVQSVLEGALEGSGLDPMQMDARIAVTLGKAGFVDASASVTTLSGGWKKRLAIARELVREPELLLLDEPTNHLDVEGILWLEELLRREPEAFVAVSHDRYFLEAAARRVIELNRAFAEGLFDVQGSYSAFLEKKDELLAGQASYQESLRNRVRGELVWLARKAKARTRKAQARIDEAYRIQDELADLDSRSRTSSAGIDFVGTDRRTKRLLVAKGLAKSFGDRVIVRDLDLVLSPGLRLGLLGANGSGKSTLLRMLAGLERPDAGTVDRADNLRVVTFDQHRSRLDPAVSLKRTLAPFGDSVIFQGRSIHVAGWATRFLFRSEQLETPVGRLSGGEQARALIAGLMLEPADVLFLDEPTNDLVIPTLEVLEESLLAFPGALVLVTHDRYLLDRVSTQILALDGRGGVVPYADYTQWEIGQREDAAAAAAARTRGPASRAPASAPASKPSSKPSSKKLSFREQQEWDRMEAAIEAAEQGVAAAETAAGDSAVAADHKALSERIRALTDAQAEVERLYARWAELEAKQKG